MKTNFQRAAEFHRAFNVPILGEPQIVPSRVALRLRLIQEEFDELMAGLAQDDIIEVADGITDMLYLLYGTALEFGIDADACFEEVHKSNMSKLGENGQPIMREDGKVLKGPNYVPPNLAQVLGV